MRNVTHHPFVPLQELRALLREAFAIDGLPDAAVRQWMGQAGLDVDLHARLGTLMGLPQGACVPSWAHHRGASWPDAGLRLLLPACDVQGELRGIAAAGIQNASPRAAVPAGFSQEGLLAACPLGRRALAGGPPPRALVITEDFISWLQWIELAQRAGTPTAVWGLLPHSWSDALARKIPQGCAVLLAAADTATQADRLRSVHHQLQRRAANGDVELRQWPSTLRFA